MSRPRSISQEESLERALLLFWEHGYDRTSISDLSKALGVGPSSIYNAFGSKEDLFRDAIGHYIATYADPAMQVIGTDSGEGPVEFVRKLTQVLVKLYTTKGRPAGCALFQSGGAGDSGTSVSCATTNEVKTHLLGALTQRFKAFEKAGEPLGCSPKTLALSLVATLRGLSQLACDGVGRADLLKVGEHAAQSCVAER